MRKHKQQGFSLVEVLVVIAIIMIISAFSTINMQNSMAASRVDTAYSMIIGQLRSARQEAVSNRRVYRVTFTQPGTSAGSMSLDLMPLAVGGGCAYGVAIPQSTVTLPYDIRFVAVAGIPTGANAPDGIGAGGNAIDLDQPYVAGGTTVYFQPDGSARDNLCRPAAGVVYMARPGQLQTSRAVDFYGLTGRIKGYRFTTVAGVPTWQ